MQSFHFIRYHQGKTTHLLIFSFYAYKFANDRGLKTFIFITYIAYNKFYPVLILNKNCFIFIFKREDSDEHFWVQYKFASGKLKFYFTWTNKKHNPRLINI
jgi:hypothetical protein